jgi:hypothetical protein
MAATTGAPLALTTDASAAKRHGRKAFIRGAALATVGFVLYVVVGGAALTNVLSGSVADHAVESTQLTASAGPRQVEPTSGTPVVVGITIADAYCESLCRDPFDILCTTSKDRIAADWIVVSAADFDQVYRQLGCEPRAE